jgi:uncharacterized protein
VKTTDRLRILNIHEFQAGEKPYLFEVDTGAIVGLGEVAAATINCLRNGSAKSAQEVIGHLKEKYKQEAIEEAIEELEALEIIGAEEPEYPWKTLPPFPFPLRTLVCNITHDCNLRCGYCYAEGGTYRGERTLMTQETARRCIDFLLQNSGENRHLSLVFFGGEPLLNLEAIRAAIDHGQREEVRWGKEIDFSLTTNATLTSEEIVRFLNENRVGVTVSLDGPPQVHDRARIFPEGHGSYEATARGVRLLLESHCTRPMAARVTVTQGVGNLEETFFHLREMGFFQVGFCPVATQDKRYALSPEDLSSFLTQLRRLARLCLEEAKGGKIPALSNLSNLLQILHQGQRRPYPCGAGLGLLGIDPKGKLHPCHRFAGFSELSLGQIDTGLDREQWVRFFRQVRQTKRAQECQKCWMRYLCGGGCYFESLIHCGDPFAPNLHYCDWLAKWIEEGLKIYAELIEHQLATKGSL